MKKIVFALMLSAAFCLAKAQETNNICVWNAMNTYNGGGGADDLEKALKCSDDAIANENTNMKPKTWFYRGEIYTLVFLDTTLRKRNGTSSFEAVKAFRKLYEMNDPKFKDWDDVYKYLMPLATSTFNEAVDKYGAKNYAQAAQFFYSIKDINAILEGKGKKPNIDLVKALQNAAVCYDRAADTEGSLRAYKDWFTASPDTMAYIQYGLALKKAGKTEEAKKIFDEGVAKFPKNANLLVEKINFFLEAEKFTEALAYVNNLLDVEPNNDGALFIKGQSYDKMGKEDSVAYYYDKALAVNPKNLNALINTAAMSVNKAKVLFDEMNKLGNSPADIKKYDELKAKCKELYAKAKPYLLRAQAIKADDAQVNRTLKQIDSFMASN